MIGAIGIQQSIRQRIGGTQGSAIPGESVEIFLQSQQRESAGAGTLEFDRCGNGKFKKAPRSSPQSRVLGSPKHGSQSPYGSAMTVFRAFRLLPLAFIAQAVSEPFRCWIE